MIDKLALIRPEIALFITTCVVMIVGLSKHAGERRSCAWISGIGLVIAGFLAWTTKVPLTGGGLMPALAPFAKTAIAAVSLALLCLLTGTVDRGYESRVAAGERFDPIRSSRGEFFAFFLFSVAGVMLCASADDLVWLFLALELTSLPTYIMVAISSPRLRSQEAGVKYFFLGAFGAAIFLYGFALLYGATGTTMLPEIAAKFATDGVGALGAAGLTLALVGVCFKIAAVPMHFYTPDVYEGAATPVTAYLAFAPKAAGFLAIFALVTTAGWTHTASTGVGGESLPEAVRVALWVIAALTMTVGNVLAILQSSVKRMLAYSSVAHSGYMLVGVIAGPGDGGLWRNGLAATLFYLVSYGVMNLGAFAALACVERGREGDEHGELESVDDIRGLCQTRPLVGWSLVLCVGSLLGFPPLLGFFAKLFLLTSAVASGEIVLAIVLALNSAIAGFYYLRLMSAAMFDEPGAALRKDRTRLTPFAGRVVATVVSGVGVVALVPMIGAIHTEGRRAVEVRPNGSAAAPPVSPEVTPAPAAAAVTDEKTPDGPSPLSQR